MVMYRKDLMEKAGPHNAREADLGVHQAGGGQDDRQSQWRVRHLLARQARLGREHGVPDRHSNSFGARWFDEKWNPQFNSPEWKATLDYYVPLMKADGPPRRFGEWLQ